MYFSKLLGKYAEEVPTVLLTLRFKKSQHNFLRHFINYSTQKQIDGKIVVLVNFPNFFHLNIEKLFPTFFINIFNNF